MGGTSYPRQVLHGIPVSPGIAMGPAYSFHPERRETEKKLITQEKVPSEVERLERALDRAHNEILHIDACIWSVM